MLWARGGLWAQLVCGGDDGGPIHENQRQPGGPWLGESACGDLGEVQLEESRQQRP